MVARLFLRLIALIYLLAFWSLSVQILGLVGGQGILPARNFLNHISQYLGKADFRQVPTLCWLNCSDGFLVGLCLAGCILAVFLFFGVLPWLTAFLLWLIYLSLTVVGQDFLGFQWDNLLLEAGFLCIFLFPFPQYWRWHKKQIPSKMVVWLLRLLLFKLMFESGLVKLLSGDPLWGNLSALTYHYLTQPLPNIISWYMYQLPLWFAKLSCLFVFVVELVVPFLIFFGSRTRWVAFWVLSVFQLLIILTGNYGFFNLLTIALCFTLLDDKQPQGQKDMHPLLLWHTLIVRLLLVIILAVDVVEIVSIPWPSWVGKTVGFIEPFRSINAYGLFAVMTTQRDEIIIEGSQDAIHWKEYEFYWKPGDVTRPPGWAMPYQPRLDWQMWFAALGDFRENSWVVKMMFSLLKGSKPVIGLLKFDPFAQSPPKYVRALVYEYRFTDSVTKKQTHAWWQRSYKGPYLPVLSL